MKTFLLDLFLSVSHFFYFLKVIIINRYCQVWANIFRQRVPFVCSSKFFLKIFKFSWTLKKASFTYKCTDGFSWFWVQKCPNTDSQRYLPSPLGHFPWDIMMLRFIMCFPLDRTGVSTSFVLSWLPNLIICGYTPLVGQSRLRCDMSKSMQWKTGFCKLGC